MRIRISHTARQSGYGKDRWKKVLGLTPTEKSWVLDNGDDDSYLCFLSERRAGGNHGTRWRYAQPRWSGQFWNPRVPPDHIIETIILMSHTMPTVRELSVPIKRYGILGFAIQWDDGSQYSRYNNLWNNDDALTAAMRYLIYRS